MRVKDQQPSVSVNSRAVFITGSSIHRQPSTIHPSKPVRPIIPPPVCNGFNGSGGKDLNDLGSADGVARYGFIAHIVEAGKDGIGKPLFDEQGIGQPLVMKFGFINGLFGGQLKIDDIDQASGIQK